MATPLKFLKTMDLNPNNFGLWENWLYNMVSKFYDERPCVETPRYMFIYLIYQYVKAILNKDITRGMRNPSHEYTNLI